MVRTGRAPSGRLSHLDNPLPECCAVRALQAACQPATAHWAAPHVCLCLPSRSRKLSYASWLGARSAHLQLQASSSRAGCLGCTNSPNGSCCTHSVALWAAVHTGQALLWLGAVHCPDV